MTKVNYRITHNCTNCKFVLHHFWDAEYYCNKTILPLALHNGEIEATQEEYTNADKIMIDAAVSPRGICDEYESE